MDLLVSVVIPVKNGENFIGACLESLLKQDYSEKWEISIFNDGSTDRTESIIQTYIPAFTAREVEVILNSEEKSGGVGYAKNKAVRYSNGQYVCFCDADDVSYNHRLSTLVEEASKFPLEKNIFFGSRFNRMPEDSTVRYTRWANNLSEDLITKQIYTSHGPTIIAPTWFISRKLFDMIGGFRDDIPCGFPEDLDFFFKSFSIFNVFYRKIEKELVLYRYHGECATFSVLEKSIWDMRMQHLRKNVLCTWKKFTIWSVGKQGKRFFKCLSEEEKNNVIAFCDVDIKKLKRGFYEEYNEIIRKVTHQIPIVSVSEIEAPVVICVKLDMTGGDLEHLLDSKSWIEGKDYIIFS